VHAYFLIMTVTLIYRFRGWPRVQGWFSLGRWGIAVNIVHCIAWPAMGSSPPAPGGSEADGLADEDEMDARRVMRPAVVDRVP
jgi:hypothetical protein